MTTYIVMSVNNVQKAADLWERRRGALPKPIARRYNKCRVNYKKILTKLRINAIAFLDL